MTRMRDFGEAHSMRNDGDANSRRNGLHGNSLGAHCDGKTRDTLIPA
jgi:hypothetical protein